jgi:hypothetical protein
MNHFDQPQGLLKLLIDAQIARALDVASSTVYRDRKDNPPEQVPEYTATQVHLEPAQEESLEAVELALFGMKLMTRLVHIEHYSSACCVILYFCL